MKCKIVPATADLVAHHQGWVAEHGGRPLPPPDGWIFTEINDALLVMTPATGAVLYVRPDHVLLCGLYASVSLMDAEEDALTKIMIGSAMSFATALGRQLRAQPSDEAMAALMASHGFQPAGPALPGLMFVEPGIGPFEVAVAQKQEPAPTAREPLGPVGKETAKPNRRVRRAAAAAKRHG